MNFLAVFLCAILASSFVELKLSNYKIEVSCPCGKTGLNHTFSVRNFLELKDACKRWANCKECRSEVDHCVKCPTGYSGSTCAQVAEDGTTTRPMRRNEQLLSIINNYLKNNTKNKPFTQERAGKCKMKPSGIGFSSFNCTTGAQGTRCDVLCNYRPQGRFYCFRGKNWEPSLPYCVKNEETSMTNNPEDDGYPCDSYRRGRMYAQGRVDCPDETQNRTSCADPGIIPEAHRVRNNGRPVNFEDVFLDGESVIFSCLSNQYFLVGASMLTCVAGTWSAELPRCIRPGVFCPDPGHVDNADRQNVDGSVPGSSNPMYQSGQSVVFTCKNGFALQGSSFITCQPTGRWSVEKPICTPTVGPQAITRTTSENPDPELVYCNDPGRVPNAERKTFGRNSRIRRNGFLQGSWLQFFCDTGFHRKGEESIFCMVTGEWSAPKPTCEPSSLLGTSSLMACADPGPILNGQMIVYPASGTRRRPKVTGDTEDSEYAQGTRLQFSCEDGYTLTGPSSITCNTEGYWTAVVPSCVDDDEITTYCEKPASIENGRIVLHPSLDGRSRSLVHDVRYPQGTRLQILCEQGHTLVGESSVTCGQDGRWSSAPPTCQKDVPNPDDVMYCDNRGPIVHGQVKVIPGPHDTDTESKTENPVDYPQGTRLQYACDDGYTLTGTPSVTCEGTGFWSDRAPSCEVGNCGKSLLQTVGKITHGERTKAGEWPWTVAIAVRHKDKSNVVCGGVLIGTRTVLTAAHCFDTPDVFELFFGKYRRKTEDDDEKVEKRTNLTLKIHPSYNKTTYDSDIALVRFTPPITYSDRIQPICLPSSETTAANIRRGKKGYVTGWGLNEKDMPSDALFMAHLPVLPGDYCVKAYQRQGLQLPITTNMFCAGFEQGGTSACTGDSGSPIVFHDKKRQRYTAEGVVSFGVSGECGLPRRYTVFTKIQPYLPWIFNNKS